MNWPEYSKNLTWVCGIKSFNSGPTIYACLQAASKNFNNIIVTDDGSKDETFKEIEKFCSDYPDVNVKAFDVDLWDPLPDQILERDHGNTAKSHPKNKSHTKSQIKNFLTCKKYFPDGMYFSLEDDVILFEGIRERLNSRIEKWKEPRTDTEFFNLINTVNKDYVRIGLDHKGMNRRKLYENSGDWTFACFWLGGDLQVGPDPVNPWGACLFPWLPKNQSGKKGQDVDYPYGLHLTYYRRTRDDFLIEEGMKRIGNVEEIKKEDSCLDTSLMSKLKFKIKLLLNEEGRIKIEEIQ
jgi:glycosyltransferase involved in cell wall biosynthesis